MLQTHLNKATWTLMELTVCTGPAGRQKVVLCITVRQSSGLRACWIPFQLQVPLNRLFALYSSVRVRYFMFLCLLQNIHMFSLSSSLTLCVATGGNSHWPLSSTFWEDFVAVSSLDSYLTGKFTVQQFSKVIVSKVSKVSINAMFFIKTCLLVSCELAHTVPNKICCVLG